MGSARPPAILIALAAAAVLTGCGTSAKARKVQSARRGAGGRSMPAAPQAGAFHTVKAGETTFAIAQAYRVPVATLVRENALADPAAISVGQRLFIPGVAEAKAEASGFRPPASGQNPSADPPLPNSQNPACGPRLAACGRSQGQPSGLETDEGPGSAASRKPQAASRTPQADRGPRTPPVAKPEAGRRTPEAQRPQQPQRTAAASLAWPVHGVIFSPFGTRARDQHDGIDLAAPEGSPVVAADAGTVLFVGTKRGYGNLILVGHDRDVVTVYAHNRENLVSVGQKIARGALIARVGKTGNATGPHLHFEVRVAARPHNPLAYLR